MIDLTTPCIRWTGHIDRYGYGKATGGLAHRIIYARKVGPIPDGLQLDHLCLVKACVNPDHLEPVTNLENMRRRFLLQDRCKQGHLYDEVNTYRRPAGHRDCRVCIRARVRKYSRRAVA